NRFLERLGLEITPAKQADQVSQPATLEFRRKCYAQDIGVVGVVKVVVLVAQPSHLLEFGRGSKFGITLAELLEELRCDCQMTKIINALSEMSSIVGLIGGDLRLGEVGLTETDAFRVDAAENHRNGFDVQVSVEFNQTDLLAL